MMAAALFRICRLQLSNSARLLQLAPILPLCRSPNDKVHFVGAGSFSTSGCHLFSAERQDSGKQAAQRPKTVPKPLVSLLGPDKDALQVVLLEEAEKIAKRRGLRLEKVSDPEGKSQRATYRLLQHHSGHSGRLPVDTTTSKAAPRIAKIDHKEKQVIIY